MVVFRLQPGDIAPCAGHALVGHYGEATTRSVWRDERQRLPLMGATYDYEPWFVLEYEANEATRVA
jgi:hypothetical protein